jgi:hypothetical protein
MNFANTGIDIIGFIGQYTRKSFEKDRLADLAGPK